MNRKIINKSNLLSNANFFKRFAPNICAVVKANAYGHGLEEVVRILSGHVEFFGVSSIVEGERILKVNPNAKVIVLSKCSNFDYLNKFYLTATSISDIKKAIANGKTERCFIKLNCGMNRFGIDCKNDNLLKKVKKLIKNRVFAGFSAHFSSISNKKVTQDEYETFFAARVKLEKAYPICFGGSGAKKLPCDILRVGLGLYGYGDKNLKKVMTLTSSVLQLRTLEKGECAGYNHTFKAKRRTTLAVVGAGYADGFSRDLSKKVKVEIGGKLYNIVGNICMDCMFVDVTGGLVNVGDSVTLFSDGESFSKAYGRIDYEILTSFNSFRGESVIK